MGVCQLDAISHPSGASVNKPNAPSTVLRVVEQAQPSLVAGVVDYFTPAYNKVP